MDINRIVIASNNSHKISEIGDVLIDLNIDVIGAREAGIRIEIEEDGETFEANAAKKALGFAKCADGYALADDSGLEVDALNGRPGLYSARYAGDPCDTSANNRKLLAELDGCENRAARFVCVVAFARPGELLFTVRGEVEGVIVEEPRGKSGFGYDPLFYYEPAGKTFAEMEPGEKNAVSHRGRAVNAFRARLASLLKKA